MCKKSTANYLICLSALLVVGLLLVLTNKGRLYGIIKHVSFARIVSPEEEIERLQWEGFAEKAGLSLRYD